MIWCMELDELKGNLWIAYLLEKGRFKSLAELHDSLNVVGSVQLWSAYKKGTQPQETTVKLVDKAVPGSGSFWWSGPGELPLWAVLGGDMPVCGSVVSSLLNDYRKPARWMLLNRKPVSAMGDADKVKALLEIVLPESLWLPTNPKDAEFVHPLLSAPAGNALKGWLSLPELFARPDNAVAVGYLQDRLKAKEQGVIRSFVSKMTGGNVSDETRHNLTNKHYVLAFIALVHLCYESKDYLLMPAPHFIKQGIYQSVVDAFGMDVADFVKEI